ncbi:MULTISPECIES: FAD-dependent oxidoreductase [Actinoalloteichus]|uniref:2-polyprenyl-6-methoxyphenol hydroxylase-like oxidoreductase n=1 Tax=Actinoalloteichus fjordicus TaxID=1612552 RepID=A0AAC9LAW9_9PSEU|nr:MULTISPECIES: NAD(P)/FAD-dependent oxidoreductase [Actinoalloteichus]APU14232.1 2-polyprenyl-6-methoxyphenol hydroxylase-like oxidoreductase [Actinoalloteichus fjordicus]APU20201.1 2-polyprenyl-6-methoxyphenol hydroxylase-like oxidoreductase [Actinoalloteichus sp. GBA129-24]
MTTSNGQRKRVLVIGCGIAGPVVALYLKKAGFEPVVHERRAADAADDGGSFNLAPNGLSVLRTLGLADKVVGIGQATERTEFLNHRGRRLALLSESTVLLHRGELHRLLVAEVEAQGIPTTFGHEVTEVESTADGVRVRFEDGAEDHGDLLVGADGIRSRVRHAVVKGLPQPRYTEMIDSGGIGYLPGLKADGTMRMTFGLKGFFGYQVLPDGHVFWFQNYHQADEPSRHRLRSIPNAVWREHLMEMHQGDRAPIVDIIASTDEIDRYLLFDAPTLPKWHTDRIVLLGDAAHAMGPHTGQGASMALEDAIVLARSLRDGTSIAEGLADYERIRRPRVDHVIAQTRHNGNQKAAPGPVGRVFRDLVLPIFLKAGVKQGAALYTHQIPW